MNKRDVGLDITRIVAFVSVVSIHFFLNSGFYNEIIVGPKMFLATIIRSFFMICVPLFLLLSGYLIIDKLIEINYKSLVAYYKHLFGIVGSYIIATVMILLFKSIYLKEEMTLLSGILNVLRFDQYSWYVEMYIGLSLLVPFLNLLWNNIDSKQGHRALVLVLIIMTVFPTILNVYVLDLDWFKHPYTGTDYIKIIPQSWTLLYPIMYYYVGAYIKRYISIAKLKTSRLMLWLLLSTFVFGMYNCWRSYDSRFIMGAWNDWNSLGSLINSVLVFLLINSITYSEKNGISKILAYLSGLTFAAYVLSYVSDIIVYDQLNSLCVEFETKLLFMPLAVIASSFIALTMAAVVKTIMYMIKKLLSFVPRGGVREGKW